MQHSKLLTQVSHLKNEPPIHQRLIFIKEKKSDTMYITESEEKEYLAEKPISTSTTPN